MLGTIRPVRGKSSDCIQSLIITVASWWERRIELSFAESMLFDYNPENKDDPQIGKHIVSHRSTSDDLMLDYHGIGITELCFPSSTEALDQVKAGLERNMPSIIYLNSYWNPWGNVYSYQQLRDAHYCLVIGINSEDSSLICVDPVFSMKVERLPLDHFLKGNNGIVGCFEKREPLAIDSDKLLLRLATQTLEDSKSERFYDLARDIESKFDMEQELKDYNDFWQSAIFQRLDCIYFGRYYFSMAMDILLAECRRPEKQDTYQYLADLTAQIVEQWRKIQLSAQKLYAYSIEKKGGDLPLQMAKAIHEVAKLEERLAHYLKNEVIGSFAEV